jgi:tetratricopeptide (TPR) repeat protein
MGPSQDDYARAAQIALERGDARLALEQIGAALSFEPTNRRHRQLLDAILQRTPRPLDLLPSSGAAFFGAAAVRALVLARLGRLGDAVTQLFDVVRFRPSAPYLVWLAEWLGGPSGARGVRIDAVIEGSLLLCLAVDRAGMDPPSRQNLEAAARLLSLLRRERKQLPARVSLAESMLLRRLGRVEEARRCVERGLVQRPRDAELWVELGHVLEMLGGDAPSAMRRATELEPERASIWLDVGDAELEAGGLRAAVAAYERALALGLDVLGESHATCALRHARLQLDPASVATIAPSAHAPIAHRLGRRERAWVTELRRDDDELARIVTDFVRRVDRGPRSGPVRMRVDGLPISASTRWIVRTALAARGIAGGVADDPTAHEGAAPIEPADPALRAEAELLSSRPFDLVDLLDPSAGPIAHVAWARAMLDRFDASSQDPVSALDHHRLAVLLRVARTAASPADEAFALLVELAENEDAWLASVAWVVLGALAQQSAWARRTLWRIAGSLPEDERVPAAVAALLRSPSPNEDEREAWYRRGRSYARARRAEQLSDA